MTSPKPQPASGLHERKLLTREMAAAYLSYSPNFFDELVEKKLMPEPKIAGGTVRWDRAALDLAAEALPDRDGPKRRWGAGNENKAA